MCISSVLKHLWCWVNLFLLKSKLAYCCAFAIFILLQGHYALPVAAAGLCEPVAHGKTDKRQYCTLKLANGLKTLLISNPKSHQAQLVVNIKAGSFQDPKDAAGLAHFLEHMLFLGSQQYPDVAEIQNFLTKHGGHSNAFTSDINTVYYYQMDAKAIEGLVDRVSSAFIQPLLAKDYVNREIQAVHAEHSNNLQSDSRRQWQIIRSLANKKHPLNGFSTGNMQTLNKPDLQTQLKQFFEQYYKPANTTLSLQANLPLAELAQLVQTYFGRIAKSNQATPKIEVTAPLFEAGVLPAIIKINPIKTETRQLQFYFWLPQIAPYPQHVQGQALNYISHLLGTEVQHSFAYWLQQQGLSESMVASHTANDFYNRVTVQVSLTPKGVQHTHQISEALFKYIGLLQKKAIENWRFAELTKQSQWSFDYLIQDSIHHTINTTFALQEGFAAPNMLLEAAILDDFEPQLLHQLLEQMDTKNLLVALTAPDQPTNQIEPIYQTPYQLEVLPQASQLSDQKQKYMAGGFQLPTPNPFLPEKDFIEVAAIGRNIKRPQLIYNQAPIKLWYAQHAEMEAPLASLRIHLKLNQKNYYTAKNKVLTQILANHISEQLKAKLYPAISAGMNYSIIPSSTGLTIHIEGYRPSIPKLLAQILPVLTEFEVDDRIFQQLAFSTVAGYQNILGATNAIETTSNSLQPWVVTPGWTPKQLLTAFEQINPEDLKKLTATFIQQAQFEVLYYGHLQAEDSEPIIQLLKTLGLQSKSTASDLRPYQYIAQKKGSFYIQQVRLNSQDSASALVFQLDTLDLYKGLQLAMLQEILQKPFFFELRTKQQLGYVVFSHTLSTRQNVPLWAVFYVQSPNEGPVYLRQQTLAFLKDFRQNLPSILAQNLPLLKDSYKNQLLDTLKNYKPASKYAWGLVQVGNWQFDKPEWQLEMINRMTTTDLVELYDSLFDEKNQRVLAIDLYKKGLAKQTATAGKLVKSQAEYQKLTGRFENIQLNQLIKK